MLEVGSNPLKEAPPENKGPGLPGPLYFQSIGAMDQYTSAPMRSSAPLVYREAKPTGGRTPRARRRTSDRDLAHPR